MASLVISEDVSVWPVTVDEAKTWLRETGTEQDTVIDMLIRAATTSVEDFTHRALITKSYTLRLDAFPPGYTYGLYGGGWQPETFGVAGYAISLPMGKVTGGTVSISYIASDGSTVAMVENTDFVVDVNQVPCRVYPAYSKVWPSTRLEPMAVRVGFEAGYGAANDVPSALKTAILMLVAQWYENREAVNVGGTANELPLQFKNILMPYKLFML